MGLLYHKTPWCLLTIILLSISVAEGTLRVTGVNPYHAGTCGAVQLTVVGDGFGGQFTLKRQEGVGTEVKLVRRDGMSSYKCDVIEGYNALNSVVCETRKMEEGEYTVHVSVDGKAVDKSNICSRCWITVASKYTPTITVMTADDKPTNLHGVRYGAMLYASGRIFNDFYDGTLLQRNVTNTHAQKRTRTRYGSHICEMTNSAGDLYLFILYGVDGESTYGEFICKSISKYVGGHNLTFLMESPFGRSCPNLNLLHVNAIHEIAMSHIYPEIHSITPTTGSEGGGTNITVTGTSLVKGDVSFQIGGEDADIVSHNEDAAGTTHTVVIRSKTKPTGSVFQGNSGVKVEWWDQTQSPADMTAAKAIVTGGSTPDHTEWWDISAANHTGSSPYVVGRASFFYVPSQTGNYQFYLKTNTETLGATLDLSTTDNDPSAKSTILTAPVTAFSAATANPTTSLTKGKAYYTEMVFYGSMGAYVECSTFSTSSIFNEGQTSEAFDEKQDIATSGDVTTEKQVVDLTSWPSTPSTAVHDVYDLTVDKTDLPFRLCIANARTAEMSTVTISEDLLKSELQNLVSLASDETVQVNNTAGHNYIITIESDHGPILMEADDTDNVVTLVHSTTGSSTKEKVVYEIEDRRSPPVSPNATAQEVEDALELLCTVRCSSALMPPVASNQLYYKNDYEDASQAQTINEPFCGRQCLSTKSGSIRLYHYSQTTDTPISLKTYTHIGFAYKGKFKSHLRVHARVKTATRDVNTWRWITYGFIGDDNWHYANINLLEEMERVYGEDIQVALVYQIYIDKSPYYPREYISVDEFYSGVANSGINHTDLVYRRSLPHFRCKSLTVTKTADFTYEVEIVPYGCAIPDLLTATNGAPAVTSTTKASPPIAGTFSLSWDGKTATIPADMTEEAMKSLLEADLKTGKVDVVRTGTCAGYTWRVTWLERPGGQPLLTDDDTQLTGPTNVQAAVTRSQSGGMFYEPITWSFLRTLTDKPQVVATVSGLPSVYRNGDSAGCTFEYLAGLTPTISAINPTSGHATDVLTITGSGFDTDASKNYVTIGTATCDPTSSTATQIVCTLGVGTSGSFNPLVFTPGGKPSTNTVAFDYTVDISSVSPAMGSEAGCTEMTITGSGFGATPTVTVGGTACPVKTATNGSITCMVPAGTGTKDVVVTLGSRSATKAAAFQYVSPVAITAINASSAGAAGGEVVELTSAGFGATAPTNVYVGGKKATVKSFDDTKIVIVLPPLPNGNHDVKVVFGSGCAAQSGSLPQISVDFTLVDIHPKVCGAYGGCIFTIAGTGFQPDRLDITMGKTACTPLTGSTSTQVTCRLERAHTEHKVVYVGDVGNHHWDPNDVQVQVGDCVLWELKASFGTSHLISVNETDDATATVTKTNGFTSGPPVASGTFRWCFTASGTHYYWSGYVDSYKTISARGKVEVGTRSAEKVPLEIKTKGSDGVTPHTNYMANTITPVCAAPATCHSLTATLPGEIILDPCYSPTLTSLSPTTGNAATTITFGGTGFGTTQACVRASVGDHTCTLSGVPTDTSASCTIDHQNTLRPGSYDIAIGIMPTGGFPPINSVVGDKFLYEWVVTSISPSEGSTRGGTRLTLQGYGFCAMADLEVAVGTLPCDVQSATYTSIECITRDGTTTDPISVTCSGVQVPCDPTCTFSATATQTPTVSAVSPSSVACSGTVTINGAGFGTDTSAIVVKFGDHQATVDTATDIQIACTSPCLPVTLQDVSVNVAGKGNADGSFTIKGDVALSSATPDKGSLNGGTLLTIDGNGFDCSDIAVQIDSKACDISQCSPGNVVCSTPAGSAAATHTLSITSGGMTFPSTEDFEYSMADTPAVSAVAPAQGVAGDTVTITGSKFSTTPADNLVSVGGAAWTVTGATATQLICTVTGNAPGTYMVKVRVSNLGNATSSPTFLYDLSLTSITPNAGSYGGQQFVTLVGDGLTSDASVIFDGDACTGVSEVASGITCLTPAKTKLVGDLAAAVSVTSGGETVTGSFSYQNTKTPEVSNVNPRRGGTAGGNIVTITGSNFGSTCSDLSVKIDGVTCVVKGCSDTQITCETGPISGQVSWRKRCTDALKDANNVVVHRSGCGNAIVTMATNGRPMFQYVDLWSSTFTWGGQGQPVAGDLVVIQPGQFVLFDTQTPVLKMVLVQGCLIFDDVTAQSKTLKLQAEYIMITDGGYMQVGTPEDPFTGAAEIILYGGVRSEELPVYGAKVIGVRNGTLEMHGLTVPVPWTTLAATANAGDTSITLTVPVTWKTGDLIVIATTGDKNSQGETETRTITSVSSDQMTLTLDEALSFTHLGVSETYNQGDCSSDSVTLDIRAEVGLLSRNVRVLGSKDAQFSAVIAACPAGFDTGEFAPQTCFQGRFGAETETDGIGVHILVHPPTRDSNAAVVHLAYVEIHNAGQEFRLGRYPVHFHNGGNMNESHVLGCSIWYTHNRAINIHGSHNLLIEHNVVYNVRGGAFFLEDSFETGNTFIYNLLLFVRASTSLLVDDLTPAGFWITRMLNNVIMHNHVAGGTHFGYWYRMLSTPSGSNQDKSIRPQTETMGTQGRFFNNTAHSQGWYGLWVFEFYFPKGAPAVFERLTAWNCLRGAEWGEGGAIQFVGFVVANNFFAGLEMLFVHVPNDDRYSLTTGAIIKDCFVIAHFNMNSHPPCTIRGVVLPFASGVFVSNVRFINFDGEKHGSQTCSEIGTVKITCVCSNRCAGYDYRFEKIKHCNSNSRGYLEWANQIEAVDLDGTLTGQGAGARVISCNPLFGTKCPQSAEWSTGIYDGCVCPASANVDVIRLTFNEPEPASLVYKNVIISNEHGTQQLSLPWDRQRSTHKKGWIVNLLANTNYSMYWENAGHIYNLSYKGSFFGMEAGNWIVMEHKVPQILKDEFEILPTTPGNAERSVPPLSYSNDHGDYAFDNDTKTLSYLIAKKTSSPSAHEDLPIFIRNTPDQVAQNESLVAVVEDRPAGALLWSDPATWALASPKWKKPDGTYGTGKPAQDASVIINSGEWLVLDEQVPDLNRIEVIKGTLEVDTTLTATLRLVYMYVAREGGFVAGFPNKPLTGQFCIELMGNHLTPDFPRTDGPYIGSKVLAFFGRADIHGLSPSTYWTKLSATAQKGASTVTVEDDVSGWAVDDEVVVTATSFSVQQTEVRKITAIKGKTITLNETLNHKHIHFKDTSCTSSVSKECVMIGEVGLLTRNVKIKGHDDGNLFTQSFGARVLVGLQTDFSDPTAKDFLAARGSLRISNVEFFRTGQEGWIEKFDARCSLSFMETGLVDSVYKPSYASGNSFHQTFAQGLCAYGATGLNITSNVIHGTVGQAIKSDVTILRVESNLVALSTWPGAYQDRKETSNKNYEAAIDISEATDIILIDNVVSAAERVGYRIDGETCKGYAQGKGTLVWRNNEVHSGLIGVAIFPEPQDGMVAEDCSRISGFRIWRMWGYGVYTQTNLSVIITDSVFCENTVSVFTMITLPHIYSSAPVHKTAGVYDSTVVGLTSEFDCAADRPQSPDDNIDLASTGKAWLWNSAKKLGRTGISFPLCSSGGNLWPFKPFNLAKKPPKHYCRMYVKGVCLAHFKAKCDGVRDFAFADNPLSPDVQHPIELAQITKDDVDIGSRAFYQTPNPDLIKPTECGTFDCDGMKSLLIKDTDGSFLGKPGALLPKANYEWNGDPRHGLGDYRIPTAMQVEPSGNRLSFSQIYNNTGIYGTHSSSWNPSERTFTSYNQDLGAGKNYDMFQVQSLDSDNITRVLSPVALRSRKPDFWFQINLVNGPRNTGICTGYACNERPACYFMLIATGVEYDLFFTGTVPQNMAINFPFTKSSDAFIVCIYNPVPQRLDVYHVTDRERYVLPKNAYYDKTTGKVTYQPIYNQVSPLSMTTDQSGASLYDRTSKQLCVVVKGPDRIFIKTVQAVIFKSGLQMTIDEFWGAKVVENLANFLGIPWYKVRLVNVVSASSSTSGRKRRSTRIRRDATSITEVFIEISNAHDDTSSSQLGYNQLLNVYDSIQEGFQNGSLVTALGNVTFAFMELSRPLPAHDSDEWKALVEEAGEGGQPGGGSLPITVPKYMHLLWLISPRVTYEGSAFSLQPTVRVVDDQGNTVTVLAIGGQPWTVSVRLHNDTGNANLLGTTTVPFVKGWGNFTDLAISRTGSYRLSFSLSRPSSFGEISIIVASQLTVTQRSLRLAASTETTNVHQNGEFNIILKVLDADGTVAQNLKWRGHVWKYTLHLPSTFSATLGGDLEGFLDEDGVTSSGNLSLTTGALETQRQYAIQVTVASDPPGYTLRTTALVHVLPTNYIKPQVTMLSNVKVTLDYDFTSIKDMEVFKAFIFNEIQTRVGEAVVSDMEVTQGSVIVTFSLGGTNDSIGAALTSLATLVDQSCQSLQYENTTLACSNALLVDGKAYGIDGYIDQPSKKGPLGDITLPLVLGIAIPTGVFVIIIIIVALVMNCGKRHKKHPKGHSSDSPEPGPNDCLNPFNRKQQESPASFSSRTALFADPHRAATTTPPVTGRFSSGPSTPRGPVRVLQKGDMSRTPTPPPAQYFPPERQDTAVSQTSKQEFSVGMSPREIPFDMSDIS